MSVKVSRETNGEVKILLANGHADALDKIKQDYRIIDDDKTVGFILSVMRDAGGEAVETVNGSFIPSSSIVKPEAKLETSSKVEPQKENVGTTQKT